MKETIRRLSRFSLLRMVALVITVAVAVWLTCVIANMGGALDDVKRAQIQFEVSVSVYENPANVGIPTSVLEEAVKEIVEGRIRTLGLDRPFILRSFVYTRDAMRLTLGRAEFLTSDSGSRVVRNILLERLPSTLMLFATAELLLFFLALGTALFLSRRYGSFLDRVIVALAPTSAAPGWFYGIFLILIFAAGLQVLPWGGFVDIPPPSTTGAYALNVMKHMVLPLAAIVISAVFISIYSWRTFFLIYSSEDYVELARAKGLSSREIERRYILRPTLPTIITVFLLMIITMWTGQIVLEQVFRWPGLGRLYFQAISIGDTPIVVGTVVIMGYLLAATVFMLDFIYAIVDPRVRVGVGGKE